MVENADASIPPNDRDETPSEVDDYLARAIAACEAGDARLGLHLYLAAFEQASEQSDIPSEDAINGMKQAWRVACSTDERTLAEYIFERLEPYLTNDEINAAAETLQNMALSRLKGFGLSTDEIEEVSEMISQDLENLAQAAGAMGVPPMFNPSSSLAPMVLPGKAAGKEEDPHPIEQITYDSIFGFSTVIDKMRCLGIGLRDNDEFNEFVAMLNQRHGLEGKPALDAIVFCSLAREDAGRFMRATIGELGLPAVTMHMEENLQGVPLLCVSAQAENAEKLNALRHGFEGGGVLVLEDLDLWGAPLAEMTDDFQGFIMANMSRGAREAISMIRSAVENPEVYVLASAASADAIDPFFLDVLETTTFIDIDYPTSAEREDIWMDIARRHPSFRALNRAELVRLSRHMPRYDIYGAARDAVEDAYKQALTSRHYHPVTPENIFEKLSAYQPLESEEYKKLEEAVIKDFAAGLDDAMEDLLK